MRAPGLRSRAFAVPALAIGTAGAVLAGGLLAGPGSGSGRAASHVDAPNLLSDAQMDTTDLYAFTSPESPDTVTMIANYNPFETPVPLPFYKFATDAHYDINIDPHGTGKPALTYRWTFKDRAKRDGQDYTLQELRPGQPPRTLMDDGYATPAAFGPFGDAKSQRAKAMRKLPGGGQTFAGQVADPFFFDARLTGLTRFGLGPFLPPTDFGIGFNVHSLAIQVPKKALALGGDPAANPVIGVWTSAGRKTMNVQGGEPGYRQISRLGNPEFTDAIVPTMSNRYNVSRPEEDHANPALLDTVRKPILAGNVQASTGAKAPPEPREDLAELFLTGLDGKGAIKRSLNSHRLNRDADAGRIVPAEELRLNMSTPAAANPSRYGLVDGDVQGWPNGRRLMEDAQGIALRVLMGEPAGKGSPRLADSSVSGPVKAVGTTFPYMALPLMQQDR